jgi:regulator of protease activity HflC (stomatin/prohibitin superfamily)
VLHRVSLRIVTMPIQSQGIITRDNVSVDVSAVAYFRVVDAVKSVVAIENVYTAIDQIAQTTLRKVVGQTTSTRHCRKPTRSTWTSARFSTCRPSTGASR